MNEGDCVIQGPEVRAKQCKSGHALMLNAADMVRCFVGVSPKRHFALRFERGLRVDGAEQSAWIAC